MLRALPHASATGQSGSSVLLAQIPSRQTTTATFGSDSLASAPPPLVNHGWTASAIILLMALGGLAYLGLSRQMRLFNQTAFDPEVTQDLRPVGPISAQEEPATGPAQKIDYYQELVRMLRDADPQTRKLAAWELKKLRDPRAVRPLVQAMVESVPEQRSLLLAALSEIGYDQLVLVSRALTLALQDENPEVRQNAVRALSRLQTLNSRNSQLLLNALGDGDDRVQETARWAVDKVQQSQRQFSAQSDFLASYGEIFEGRSLEPAPPGGPPVPPRPPQPPPPRRPDAGPNSDQNPSPNPNRPPSPPSPPPS